MQRLVYVLYRIVAGLAARLPLKAGFRLGQVAGWLGYGLLGPYRRLAKRNLAGAFGEALDPAAVRRLARRHFVLLGANLLASLKATRLDVATLRRVVELENLAALETALAGKRGVILVLSHLGNWEIFAQICQFYPHERWATVYRPLGNPYLEAHLRQLRAQRGVVLFNRHDGFHGPTKFLRAGGTVGVLVDQHAGDGGVWTPFFGRLASTSPLAALLALRTGAVLLPMAVTTVGPARWRLVISDPVTLPPRDLPADPEPPGPAATADGLADPALDESDARPGPGPGDAAAQLTARINQAVEAQVRAAPADWFWVHNRWKTPRPRFLLSTYRRGVALPPADPGAAAARLRPFRIVVRSPNWLGDAVMSIPAVQAIARGRPDAAVTVLTPAKLADLWREVPGITAVLAFPPGESPFAVARRVRAAGPFAAGVALPNSLRGALELWLAGVPRRVGYPGHRRRWLLNQTVRELPAPAAGQVRHQSVRYLELARQIGADPGENGSTPPAPVTVRPLPSRDAANGPDDEAANGVEAPFVLCPGAEYGPAKRWPAERFAETARQVHARTGARWVLVGAAGDRLASQRIARFLAGVPGAADDAGAGLAVALPAWCEDRIGQTDLTQLTAVLRSARVLLTNDTGTMHLAAWLGTPLVAIFGSTEPRLTGPVGPGTAARVRVLRHQVECSPCFARRCPLGDDDLRCLRAVSVAEAVAATLEVAVTAGGAWPPAGPG